MGADGGHDAERRVRRKLMGGYLGDFAELLRGIDGNAARSLPELLARSFPGLRYVQIARRDNVRQAVSLWKAVQTQAWQREAGADGADAGAGRLPEPVFSFRAINYLTCQLTAHDASWEAYFLGLGYEPLKVTYEELADSTDAVVRSVLEHLGIAAPDDLHIGAPRLSVQADEVSEQLVARVRSTSRRSRLPNPCEHRRAAEARRCRPINHCGVRVRL
ncbi:MAG TPA: Stf0 family sulfotransferase [Solirubrobacteraceae bacterium]